MFDKGQIIKGLIKKKESSQKALSDALGVSTQTVSTIVNGQKEISERYLKVISETLDVNPSDLSRWITNSQETKSDSDAWAQKLVDEMKSEIEELKKDKQFLQQVVTSLTEKVGKLRANFPQPNGNSGYKLAA